MDFKKHLETAWTLTLQYIAPLILMTLVMFIISFLTMGLLAPVTMAGYIHAILLLVREGREPRLQDIFSQMRLFWPLLGFGLVVFAAIVVGFMLLVLPGILVILALSFGCLFMLPLMTDKGLGLIDAVKESWAMSTSGVILDHVVVVILFVGITAIGSSVFIGSLFTQPLATIFLVTVYEERISVPRPPSTVSG
jgi:hypothetical protein